MESVVFTCESEVFRTLDAFLEHNPHAIFPPYAEKSDTGYALPLAVFGNDGKQTQKYLVDLCSRLEITLQFQSINTVPENRVGFSDLLQPLWQRFDPVRALQQQAAGGFFDDSWSASAAGIVADNNTRYILAAADRKIAGQLLKTITRFLGRGIEGRPVVHETPGKWAPYQCFWSVRGRPSLAIFRDAERAWWGPENRSGRYDIFWQWPYRLSLRDKLLQSIAWENEGTTILLGPSEPSQVSFAIADAPVLSPWTDHADYEIGSPPQVLKLRKAVTPQLPFRVSMRLIDRCDPVISQRERLEDLDRQIENLQEIRERLEMQVSDSGIIDTTYEPLYIYYNRGSEDEAPSELRRLLIEWADQHEELQRLYYCKIDAQCLGPQRGPHEVAHILTTASALGIPSRSGRSADTLGFRLRPYRPHGTGHRGNSSFALVPRWAEFGLRLFVPHDRYRWRLDIYPEPPVCESAVQKLAKALDIGPDQLDQWGVILLPLRDDKIHACRLPLGSRSGDEGPGFVSLLEAFQWNCALDVSLNTVRAEHESAPTADLMLNSINKSIEEAVAKMTGNYLDRLERDLQQFQEEFQQRQNMNRQLSRICDEFGLDFEGATSQLEVIDHESSRLAHGVSLLGRQLSGIKEQLNRLEVLSANCNHRGQEHQRLQKIYQQFVKDLTEVAGVRK